MVTKTASVAQRETRAQRSRPYAPSWLHALHGAIAALPGPTWAGSLLVGLLIGSFTQVQFTENGTTPPGQLHVPSLYWGFMATSIVWSVGAFQRLAARAFDAFRPALLADEAAAARLRYELTVIPARGSAILLGAAVVLTAAAFVLGPQDAGVVGLSAPILVGAFLAQTLAAGALFTLGYQWSGRCASSGPRWPRRVWTCSIPVPCRPSPGSRPVAGSRWSRSSARPCWSFRRRPTSHRSS